MPRNTRVSGHWLWWEGAPHNDGGVRIGGFYGGIGGEGRGKCGCGELSEVLPSASRRRTWHYAHKAAVRASRAVPPSPSLAVAIEEETT